MRPGRALLLWALPLSLATTWSTAPASAQGSSNMVARQRTSYQDMCQPPLKFAAGACVRDCPAGYRDTGRSCEFQSLSR